MYVSEVRIRDLELQLLGTFPGEFGSAKMAVARRFLVDWLEEVEFLDDNTGSQVEIALDNFIYFRVALHTRAVCVDVDGDGFGYTDGIGNLHEAASAQSRRHQGFGDVTRSIRAGTVNL